MVKPIIAKVRESISGQKVVTIPRESNIKKDAYVKITELEVE